MRPFLQRLSQQLLSLTLGFALLAIGLVGFPGPSTANSIQALQPYLDRLRNEVSEFQLDNGMRFVILERHEAPVISFVTYANVGGTDEPVGKTGVAHYLEHLAFKGTPVIGTKDFGKEQAVLRKLDRTFEQIKRLAPLGQTSTLDQLKGQFEALKTEASQYVQQNELGQVIEREGGVGLNAATSADSTTYFYSLPANKLELWMSLESERFLHPVFREFYEEKEVILEERRMRFDNDPVSQLFEALKAKAFEVHPYGQPIIGHVADLQGLTRQDVQTFFDAHYGPSHLTVAIVGDVDPKQVQQLAQSYFGRYQSRAKAVQSQIAPEPPQTAERQIELRAKTQPWYMEAYHIPAASAPDGVAYSVLGDILSSGRTSRLYRTMVEQEQVALAAQGFTGYPGDKYPNLMMFYALVAPGHTVDEVASSLHQQLTAIATTPVEAMELERVKNKTKASVLRSLTSNMGMAQVLAEYEGKTGSWENLLKDLEAIAQLTPADLQRIAQTTLRPENRTVGRLLPEDAAS